MSDLTSILVYTITILLRSDSVQSAIGKDLESGLKKLKSERTRVQDMVDKNEAGHAYMRGVNLSVFFCNLNHCVAMHRPLVLRHECRR